MNDITFSHQETLSSQRASAPLFRSARSLSLLLVSCFALLLSLSLSACATSGELESDAPYASHSVAWDLESVEGLSADGKVDGLVERFDPSWLMGDAFFTNTHALTESALQAFFEQTPYGERSWLADALIDGVPASRRLLDVALDVGINPILLLSRMQVEQSLISRSARPSEQKLNSAFGCGCPDNRACYTTYQGFSKQLACAGDTLRKLYNDSETGVGLWVAGKSRRTLEGELVRPGNHATAALYAYTPWILRGRGGNWLVWNVTEKFARYFKERGSLMGLQEDPSCLYRSGRAFIGDPCGCALDCAFWIGEAQGVCHPAGFCTIPCEGGCPDQVNKAPTFCIEDPYEEGVGICVPQASEHNGRCADLPHTLDLEAPRFVGSSGSAPRDALVCAPQ